VPRNTTRAGSSTPIQGIEQKRVVLGATYPPLDNPAHVTDALRQLGDRGKYINRDQDRYWLSLQQTVSRIVQEQADGYDRSEVEAELTRLLREENDRGVFARVHRVPDGTAAVDDEPTCALVVLGLDKCHSKKAKSPAREFALEVLARRGGQPRVHRNSLVFLAPDVDRVDTLDSVLRRKMAWQSVKGRVRELNLDQHNISVVESRLAQAVQAVADTIRETYKWVIVPFQEAGSSNVELETIIMNGNGTLAERVSRKADATEFVLRTYAAPLLRQQIDRLKLWDKQPHVQVDTMCGYYTQYLYMPRVRDHDVVRTAISRMGDVLLPEQDGFAYADAFEDGRYRGLVLGADPAMVSGTGLLVEPKAAARQIAQEKAAQEAAAAAAGTTVPSPAPGTPGTPAAPTGSTTGATTAVTAPAPGTLVVAPAAQTATRFHATKALDTGRPVRDISQISDEILTPLLAANGVAFTITLDIESSGLERLTPDQVVALRENLKTLGFTDYSVE
jgi:hypothetical protein